jgi:hypothetical protein
LARGPGILTILAFCSITFGIVLAALSRRGSVTPFVRRRVIGSAFLLGFILLGLAIRRWHVD